MLLSFSALIDQNPEPCLLHGTPDQVEFVQIVANAF
jgi:hypothetical protein